MRKYSKMIRLLGSLLAILIAIPAVAQAPILIHQDDLVIIQNNTVRASSPPCYIKPIVYGSLLGCIEYYESSGNPLAVGDAGEKGCLQFLPSTFQMYCVDKYHLKNDIFDPEIQRRCADMMIQDNWYNVYQWSVAELCL